MIRFAPGIARFLIMALLLVGALFLGACSGAFNARPLGSTVPDGIGITVPAVTPTLVPSTPIASPSRTPTSDVATALPVATLEPAGEPTLPASVDHEFVPTPRPSARERFIVGGIDFADPTHPLDVTYPVSMDGSQTHLLQDVDLLLSDVDGTNLAIFQNIGSWVGKHKFFVYSDIIIGSPILSVHNGYWSGKPLDSEPLRHAIEGSVYEPFPIEQVQSHLDALVGQVFTIEQSDVSSLFEISQAIRMDPQTTADYLYRAGELSSLLDPVERPQDSVLWLMCSTGQPDEVDEVFPARFVLVLTFRS